MPNTFHFTENSYEQSIISLFKEMGYEYHYGPDLEADTGRELTDATIPGALRKAMLAINGTDKAAAVDEAIRQIRELFSQPLVSANVTFRLATKRFGRYIQDSPRHATQRPY